MSFRFGLCVLVVSTAFLAGGAGIPDRLLDCPCREVCDLHDTIASGGRQKGVLLLVTANSRPIGSENVPGGPVPTVEASLSPRDSVVVNEIMYMPAAGEPEWVELFNTGSDTADVRGWSLTDAGTSSRHPLPANAPLLPPRSFVVLTADTTALLRIRPRISSPRVQLATFPSLNNTGDFIHLFDRASVCRDSVEYRPAWGGKTGVSLERIDGWGASMDPADWASCADSSGATAGRANSIARAECDLAAVRLGSGGRCTAEVCDLQVVVRNAGRQPAAGWRVSLYDDVNRQNTPEEAELIGVIAGGDPIPPGDSLIAAYAWEAPVAGSHLMFAVAELGGDERQSNNCVTGRINVPFLPGAVRINEVMYEPLSGMPEYVEFANTATRPADMENCTLSDRPTASGSVNQWKFSGRAFRVPPSGFCVIISDTSGPFWFPKLRSADQSLVATMHASSLGLNNDGDKLFLRDAGGVMLDSLEYSPAFHTSDIPDVRGRSLELVNPSLDGRVPGNWGTCVDPAGGTPGMRNSISVPVAQGPAVLAASPNPFSPDGDGMDDVTIVNYALPVRTSMVRMRIYDVRGRLIKDLANNVPVGTQGSFVWDGRDDGGRRARVGIYVVMLEAMDNAGGVMFAAKCTVVLATHL